MLKTLIVQGLILFFCTQSLFGQQEELCPAYLSAPDGSISFIFSDNPGYDISNISVAGCDISDTIEYMDVGTFVQPNIYTIQNPVPDFPLNLDFITFDFTGTGSVACFYIACTLSVELLDFVGHTTDENTNLLKWTTATETNSQWIIPERSIDGHSWEILERIPGQGWSSAITQYTAEDTQPYLRTYYRLRMVDFDGIISYSDVVVLKRENISGLSISPIPTEKEIFLQFDALKEEDISISIIDINGRKLSAETISVVIGLNTLEIDLSIYPSGLYYLSLDNGTDRQVERIVKY